MELEEINNMNIDPPKISENRKNRSFGEVTLESELWELVHSNTHRISGRKSRMMVEEGRDWTPRSEKVIDKFVKSYFPSFYDDYIITKKEIFEKILTVLLGYILMPLVLSIPFYLSIYNLTFLNSIFESVSGFTSTGFTIFENIKHIDQSLILWRSSIQWIGGLYFLCSSSNGRGAIFGGGFCFGDN